MRYLAVIATLVFTLPVLTEETVVLLGSGADSAKFAAAFTEFSPPPGVNFEYLCTGSDDLGQIVSAVRRASVLIINARSEQLRRLTARELDLSRTRLYSFSSRLLPAEIPAEEPEEFAAYLRNPDPDNLRNLVLMVINRELDSKVAFQPPRLLPEIGITHPAAAEIFPSISEYVQWAKREKRFKPNGGIVAFAVHPSSITPGELKLFGHLTDELEQAGINVAIVYGDEVRVIRELLLDDEGRATVDAVLAMSFKFKSGLGEPLRLALEQLDVPVFNALRLYRQTTREWEESSRGMNDFSVAFAFIAPEISGLIEPSLLFGSRLVPDRNGRMIQEPEPFPAQLRITALRLKKFIGLRRKNNSDKRIAILVYNGSGGKQNIGASGLNVPRSLSTIIPELHRAGYRTGGLEKIDESVLTARLLACSRNVGSWAPGELEQLAASPETVKLPVRRYAEWFAELPESFRNQVISVWGPPDQASIMVHGDDFILPMLKQDNLVIMPEPMRGWLDNPHQLIHSATLVPHHQYLAAYLWLQREFQADAMIHLGRHASFEWLPGKQLGLAADDAPRLVRGDVPDIYPYIVDGIGEGIVAKRRGSSVMIAHLTPALRTPTDAPFLAELRRRLSECGSADPGVKAERLDALRNFAYRERLDERLDLGGSDWVERLEEYASRCAAITPFGLHTFGVSPGEAEIAAMTDPLPETERGNISELLRSSGEDEIKSLLRALAGRFIPPGPSGDPIRNPEVLPAGRNFYSFDPAIIPTPEAVLRGEKLAAELLERESRRLGRFPTSVGVVLWAGETIRNDGANEAMAMALMGMRFCHDENGRVTGVKPVPGTELRRPRVEVVITTSGAYRDQFGDLLRRLDQARRIAATLDDAENFIRADSRGIFFPAPGTYGTRIGKLTGASGMWEQNDDIAASYLRGLGWSLDEQGNFSPAEADLHQALSRVETVAHSRSGNVYGVTDTDDVYQYLGGLALAVRFSAGTSPESYILDQRRPGAETVTAFRSFLGAELDSRLGSREWIQAMMRENYAGGKTIARMTDNLWGWQAVTPEKISPAEWDNLYDIYVEDRYELGLRDFFSGNNEWSFQSITARMLEAVRKGYWQPEQVVRRRLASAYAQSVIRSGMACCDHTCNNPLLNQLVVTLISMPGMLSPEQVLKFQIAVERAAGRTLDEQLREQQKLQQEISSASASIPSPFRTRRDSSPADQQESALRRGGSEPVVKGYRMQDFRTEAKKTRISSSGLQWTILTAVFGVLAIFAWGYSRPEK